MTLLNLKAYVASKSKWFTTQELFSVPLVFVSLKSEERFDFLALMIIHCTQGFILTYFSFTMFRDSRLCRWEGLLSIRKSVFFFFFLLSEPVFTCKVNKKYIFKILTLKMVIDSVFNFWLKWNPCMLSCTLHMLFFFFKSPMSLMSICPCKSCYKLKQHTVWITYTAYSLNNLFSIQFEFNKNESIFVCWLANM